MSLAGELVDGLVHLIGGGMALEQETREAAKEEVRAIIARAKDADLRELLSKRADAITEKHLARVRALPSPQVLSHVDVARKMLESQTLSHEERTAIEAIVEELAPARLGNGG